MGVAICWQVHPDDLRDACVQSCCFLRHGEVQLLIVGRAIKQRVLGVGCPAVITALNVRSVSSCDRNDVQGKQELPQASLPQIRVVRLYGRPHRSGQGSREHPSVIEAAWLGGWE